MKFLLSMIICSQVAGTCLDPFPWPTTFNTQYDCLMFGYEQSIVKMKEIEIPKRYTHYHLNRQIWFSIEVD